MAARCAGFYGERMSQMKDRLLARATTEIPDELERAWQWMEDQGRGSESSGKHYYLTPYESEYQLGIVFTDKASLEGYFTPETPGYEQLTPIAEISGDGATGAIWRDDNGRVKFVGLGSDGETYLLAESPLDFLRLVSVGYREYLTFTLGEEPEEPEDPEDDTVEAHEEFRDWVKETFQVDVPASWHSVGDDEFTQWVAAKLGSGDEPEAAAARSLDALSGDAAVFLELIGKEGARARIAELLGIAEDGLEGAGVELKTDAGRATEIYANTGIADLPAYPRPERLIAGLDLAAGAEAVRSILGEEDDTGISMLSYVFGDARLVIYVTDELGVVGVSARVNGFLPPA